MGAEIKIMERRFLVKNGSTENVFPDPGIGYTVSEVKKMASLVYPLALTGTVTGPTFEKETAIYEIQCKAETKG